MWRWRWRARGRNASLACPSVVVVPKCRLSIASTLVLCLSLALGACASMAPACQRPAAPVAATCPAALLPAVDGIVQGARGWQHTFADPALQRLITQALDHNRDLRVATLRVDQARAASGIQHAERSPTIGIGAGETRSRTPADLNLTGRPLISPAPIRWAWRCAVGRSISGAACAASKTPPADLPGHRRGAPCRGAGPDRAGGQSLPGPA